MTLSRIPLRRILAASGAVYVTAQVTNVIVHGLILSGAYAAVPQLWRTDLADKVWIIAATWAVFSFCFTYLYARTARSGGIGEGIRFGALVSFLMNVPGLFDQYAIYPIPFSLAFSWFVLTSHQFMLYGLVASLICKPGRR